jgi:aspartyl-tRNA(Asn)/glutamyl-tRNA(Gln) amidotransferase subunit A
MELFPSPDQTIWGIAPKIRQGKLSVRQLVEQCLERIAAWEPAIRAWVEIDREGALRQAEARDQELRHGQYRGPLHRIPIGVKDIYDVAGWGTAAGSRLLGQVPATEDAVVVARLRQAGAVILGKTVTTPYAAFDPPPTANPWHADRTPGGSSSGSAAAVACGMCLAALGSQTGGSITRPAAYCGVAGCKPTYARLSCKGVLPLAPSLDHPGAIARCVRDLALLVEAMADVPLDQAASLSARLESAAPPRIGLLEDFFRDRCEPATWELFERVQRRWREAGAEVRAVALPASFHEVLTHHRRIMACEAAAWHADRFRVHPEDYPPKIAQLVHEGLATPAAEYVRSLWHREHLRRQLLGCFEAVDALAIPATPGPAPGRETTGDPAFNSPWSYVGYPVVSFPMGFSPEGLPLGVQIVGKPYDEAALFAAAWWCEQVLHRGPP